MVDLLAAELQRADGVGEGTKNKENRVWTRWYKYCRIICNEHDIFLTHLPPNFRTRLFGAFAAAIRRRQFSRPNEKHLGASTVKEAVEKLGQIFRTNVGYNPAHGNEGGGVHPYLSHQFRGIKNKDPGEKQQKALPGCVCREICKQSKTTTAQIQDKTIAWLQVLAFFFCMRSCKYSNVTGE